MKLYKLLFILPCMLLLSSCDLDRDPIPNGQAHFWKTETDIQLGLDAAYGPLYEEDGLGRGQFWAGVSSDDMIINRQKNEDEQLMSFSTPTNGSGGQYSNYRFMYRVIRRANDVIRYAPGIDMSELSMDTKLGEANFLCAYAYFFLAKRYGGLPFYDYNNPNDIDKPRETKEKTYEFIVEHLSQSIAYFEKHNLWERGDDATGRPTLGTAYGLLAKVYAHWGKYQEAKEAAEKVINSGHYELNTVGNNGYKNLFSPAGEKHKEVLFNLVNTPTRNQGTVTSIVLMSGTFTGGTGWYYFAPTKDLYKAFESGDLRREVTLKGAGDKVSYPPLIDQLQNAENKLAEKENRQPKTITAPITITSEMIKDMSTGYMCTKYAAAYDDLKVWNWESGADMPLLRYADVLLIHAEAEIFLAGGSATNNTQGVAAAAKSFNEVRVRAFGGDNGKKIAAPTFNDLMKERRCELAYEDERHYDLVRWGLAKEIYANGKTVADPRGNRTFDPIKDAHFPIPQQEIDNTGSLLKNNPLAEYSSFK